MGYPEVKEGVGNVYSYFKGEYKTIIKNTTISNGLAFSADHKFLYFIDTPTKKVAKYSYEIETGEVAFLSYVIEFKHDAFPDGMLWIAEWGGACISQWNPLNGEKVKEIKLPCKNVTSCCFDNDGNLYISTAKEDNKEDINGGGLYYVALN